MPPSISKSVPLAPYYRGLDGIDPKIQTNSTFSMLKQDRVARESLSTEDALRKKCGFLPNLMSEMAASSTALNVYVAAQDVLAGGPFNAREQQAIQAAVSSVNGCQYCLAVHGTAGLHAGISREDMIAILTGEEPADLRLRVLAGATRLIMQRKGWLEQDTLDDLESQGISRSELYVIVAYIGVKTISNYVNHIAGTEIDPEFQDGADLLEDG